MRDRTRTQTMARYLERKRAKTERANCSGGMREQDPPIPRGLFDDIRVVQAAMRRLGPTSARVWVEERADRPRKGGYRPIGVYRRAGVFYASDGRFVARWVDGQWSLVIDDARVLS